MFWTAFVALVLNVACHYWLDGPDLPLAPEYIGLTCLAVWLAGGARAAVVVLPAAWLCLWAGWVVDGRLATALIGQDILVEGTVCSIPKRDDRAVRFVLRTDRSDAQVALPRRAYIGWYDSRINPVPGETWRLKLRLRRPRGTANPGAFDFERWAYIHDIGATGYVRDSAANGRLPGTGECALTAFRFSIAAKIAGVLDGRPAMPFIVALAVGVRDWLTPGDRDLLRDSGTAHLLAISGLHVGLVAGLALVVGRLTGVLLLWLRVRCRPFFLGRIAAMIAAIGYAAMAGFAVPTVRALVMLAVVITLSFMRRAGSGLAALGAALFVVLCLEPAAPVSAGFWLSFAAVGVLMLKGLEQPKDKKIPVGRLVDPFRGAIPAQMAIAVGLAPLMVLIFERLSWIAPAVNLVLIPLFGLIVVPLVIVGSLLLLPSELLGTWVLTAAETMTATLLAMLGQLMTRVEGFWHAPVLIWPVAGLLGFAALIAIWPRPLPGRYLSLVILVVPAVVGQCSRMVPALQIVVMDVGHGLAVLVRSPDYALVYDTGPRSGVRDAGDSVVVPVLRRLGVKRLDAIVVSHFDTDHSGGLVSVLKHYPATVVATADAAAASMPDISVLPCTAPLSWRADDLVFRIASPHPDDYRRLRSDNDSSCVLIVEFGDFSMLLPGDIERVAESLLLAGDQLSEVDVVVAPHHGSKTSSGVGFVGRVAADFVIYSVAHDNRWGFPQSDVVRRWEIVSLCQLSTADSGAIFVEVSSHGADPQLRTQRGTSARIWNEPSVPQLPCLDGATN